MHLQNDQTPSENADQMDEWVAALETLFLEALHTYYQGTPMFTDSEFQTLREELDHLGSAQVRLGAMEKIWVQATSARDFDRRIREEFEMSEDDLDNLKKKLLRKGQIKRPTAVAERRTLERLALPKGTKFLNDAQIIEAGERVDERLKWYVAYAPFHVLVTDDVIMSTSSPLSPHATSVVKTKEKK